MTEVTCTHCGEEVKQGEQLCPECDDVRTGIPYDVSICLQRLESAIDDTIGKWQNRGWSTGTVTANIAEELKGLLAQVE